MTPHQNEKTFEKFGLVVIYHVSFFIFITTIGLNIIFGIIVDTFSELRDLKVTDLTPSAQLGRDPFYSGLAQWLEHCTGDP